MTRLAVVAVFGALGCAGCKDKRDPPKTDTPHPAIAIDAGVDDTACDTAIKRAAAAAPHLRAAALMSCTVCGDWKPILDWNLMSTEGGPSRAELDAALHRCNAPCDGAAAKKMASALDSARGSEARGPWRLLGESCKDKVSAVPDARNMSAPFFVLDRIARAIGGRGNELAKQLASIDVAIPAVTLSGIGPTLPDGITTIHAAAPDAITLLGPEVRLGVLPHAKLDASGVTVAGDFPGELAPKLRDAVDKLGDRPITVLAPAQMPAMKVAEIVASAARLQLTLDPKKPATKPIELAVASPTAPRGWQVPAAIPLAINGTTSAADIRRIVITAGVVTDQKKPAADGRPIRIELDDKTTVGDLAKELGVLAGEGVAAVEIAAKRK